MVHCTRCGYRNDVGSRFCANCGNPMAAASGPPAPGAYPQPAPGVPTNPHPGGNPGWGQQPDPTYGYPPQAGGGGSPQAYPGAPYPGVEGVPPPAAPQWSSPQPNQDAAAYASTGRPQATSDGYDAYGAPPPPVQGYGYPPQAQAYPGPAQAYPGPAQAYPGPAQGYPPAAPHAPTDSGLGDAGASRVLAGFLISFDLSPLGAFWPIHQGVNEIGRFEAADGLHVAIDHPTTSSHHARVVASARPGHLRLEDLGSTNGTYVNEQRLEPGHRVDLTDGDTVRFGGFNTLVKIVSV